MTGAPRAMNKWEGLGFLMALALLNYFDRNLLLPLQSMVQDELKLSDAEIGALATGFHYVYAAAALLIGWVSDRVKRKTILLASLLVWSLLTGTTGVANGFFILLLCRSLTGLGEGGYFPTAVSLIGDLFGPKQRGLAIALHGTFTTLGGTGGLMLGGVLGEAFGWRAPFFMVIVPGLALAVLMAIRFREPVRGAQAAAVAAQAAALGDSAAGRSENADAPPRRFVAVVTTAPVLLIALAAMLAGFAMNGFTQYLPKYLIEVMGKTAGEAGVLAGIGFVFTIVGVLPGGILSDRLAARTLAVRQLLVAVPYLMVAPAFVLLPLAEGSAAIIALYAAAMIGRGFAEPNIYCTIIEIVPPRERGTAQGFLLAMTFLGSGASGLVCGSILDATAGPKAGRTAAAAAAGYQHVFQVLGGASLLAGLVAFGLFVYRRRAARVGPRP